MSNDEILLYFYEKPTKSQNKVCVFKDDDTPVVISKEENDNCIFKSIGIV